jgi:Zn2+/Cd2+-exporting ATPase
MKTMSEKTIELEIPLLLPGIEDDDDGCLVRLEAALQNQKGISRAHLEREKSPVNLCLHYEPNLLSIEKVRRMAERAGTRIANRYHHLLLPIEGMDCSDCVTVIEHSLVRMDGVLAVNVSYVAQNLRIEFDKHAVDRPAIEKRIHSLGYEVPAEGMRSWYRENKEVLFSLIAGLLVLIGWLGQTFFGLNVLVATAFYIAAYFFGGREISHHTWHALRERHFDTDLLMVTAALGAAVLGEWAEGALLLFLFSLGHALEERALDRARSAVRALADLAPKTALVKRNSFEVELHVEQVALEDVVIIRPGVRIPVDGRVISGQSAVNQAPVTGESIPVEKNPGSEVFAGTINGDSVLEVHTTRLAKDSTLSRVMKLVEEAQTQKSPTQQITEKFSRYFVPLVLGADLLLIVIPPLFGVPFRESFLRAMTLLVAASPCALALGTPSAILAAIAQAARNGILIKGGAHLENLGRIKAIAFDKTGTITKGQPELTDLVPVTDLSADEVLSLATAIESRSAHPLAKAIVRAAQAQRLDLLPATDVTSITGRGVQALVSGKLVRVGNTHMFDEIGISFPEEIQLKIQALENQGKTVMLIFQEQVLVGLIAVADVLRPDAADAVANLRKLGVDKSVMLTGDNERVAAHIAGQVGLSDTYSNLMPEDKLAVIRSLVQEYGEVAMVGDGVNDAPALANSTVGIAMGGAGTDVALETADVALMGDNLAKLPFAVGLGRAARRVIIQNLTIALAVIATLVVASITGLVGIALAVIFHEGSTIVVVLNSLRLLGYQPKS